MKMSLKIIALGCWLLVGLINAWYFSQVPSKIVLQGVDITRSVLHQQQISMMWVGAGTFFAIAAFFFRRSWPLLVALSSMLYFVEWFPWSSVGIVGLWEAMRWKWILACTLGSAGEPLFNLLYFIGQIVVPFIFLTVISLVTYNVVAKRRSSAG